MNVGDLVRIVVEYPPGVSRERVYYRIGRVIETCGRITSKVRVFDTYGSIWYYRINEVKKLNQHQINRLMSMRMFSRFLEGYAIEGERAGEKILM